MAVGSLNALVSSRAGVNMVAGSLKALVTSGAGVNMAAGSLKALVSSGAGVNMAAGTLFIRPACFWRACWHGDLQLANRGCPCSLCQASASGLNGEIYGVSPGLRNVII